MAVARDAEGETPSLQGLRSFSVGADIIRPHKMAILPNLEVVNHLITRFRGSFPSRGSLASAAGVYRKRCRLYRALCAYRFFPPLSQHTLTALPEGEPLRGNGFRGSFPSRGSLASAAGVYRKRYRLYRALCAYRSFPPLSQHTLTALPEGEPFKGEQLTSGSPWGELPQRG